jgi:hypothetical protein
MQPPRQGFSRHQKRTFLMLYYECANHDAVINISLAASIRERMA